MRQKFKIGIAILMAAAGVGILAIESGRYLNSPFGIGVASPSPFWIGGTAIGDVWFQYGYMSDSAGVRVNRRFKSPRDDAQVFIGINKAGFKIQIWKNPVGFEFSMPPLVYSVILIPYPMLLFVRFVRGMKSRKKFAEGSCEKCGYDIHLNESGTCPECGTPITGRESQTT
ncbi:MAG: hypothetical protein DHS20C16_26270 [Phycisphaerae bacterium]|nr:MAG: hypothetical protein DHS20C16_26270 [Phycisphaerae bacterium]